MSWEGRGGEREGGFRGLKSGVMIFSRPLHSGSQKGMEMRYSDSKREKKDKKIAGSTIGEWQSSMIISS